MSSQSLSPAAMSGGAGTSSSLRRVIRPGRRFKPSRAEQIEERSRLLSKIGAFYREACVRLGLESTPATLARFLDSGVCVGLLDPVSNVMANTLFTSDFRPDLMDKIVDEAKLGEMGHRSIDGLVAFLIYFFPYLAGWDAQRYLLIADADLLVAARLIAADRGMMSFSMTSTASVPAFEGALRLAAKEAKHPEPQRLVKIWMSLSSQLKQAFGFLSAMRTKAETQGINLVSLGSLLIRRPFTDLGQAWDLAASRPPYSNAIAHMPYQATRGLRMALLDTIRSFYLRALARLPRHELHTRYHHSLLMAGYCYGPLDPVSNIIVNTIWYDVTFPAPEPPVLDLIGPKSLTRLESRSFYGLASYLQSRYHNLSEHEVVQCLVASCAHLSLADPNLNAAAAWDLDRPFADPSLNAPAVLAEAKWQQKQCRTRTPGLYDAVMKLEQQIPCTSVQEAYEAAATAAWHPNPEAHAAFLNSWKATLKVKGPAFWLLHNGDQLTSENVQHIASLFSPKHQGTPKITKKNRCPVIAGKMRSEAQQRRITTKVKAALGRHLLRDGEPMYELHIISAANESVGSPEYSDDEDDYLSFAPCKFRYSHVNFLVTLKGSPSADRDPILFFAEFDNEGGQPLLCCRVDMPTPFAEHVRCLYCEGEGSKIVHPATEKFHGRDKEFEEVICERRSYTNDRLICENEFAVQLLCGVEEDFMYIDPRCIS